MNKKIKQQQVPEITITSEDCLPTKMQIFHCSCGEDILIVPDIKAMNTALKNHLTIHTGKPITEQTLIELMLKQIADRYFQLTEL